MNQPLTDRLRAALNKHVTRRNVTFESTTVEDAITEGAEFENARLAPIHEAMLDVVTAAKRTLDATDESEDEKATIAMIGAIAALEAALLKLEGK